MKRTIYFFRPVRHNTEFTERRLSKGLLLMTQAVEKKYNYMPGFFRCSSVARRQVNATCLIWVPADVS